MSPPGDRDYSGSSGICVLGTGWNRRLGVLNRAGVCDSGRFEAAQRRFKSNSRPALPAGRASAAPSFASPVSIRLGEPESQTPALTRRVRIRRMSHYLAASTLGAGGALGFRPSPFNWICQCKVVMPGGLAWSPRCSLTCFEAEASHPPATRSGRKVSYPFGSQIDKAMN